MIGGGQPVSRGGGAAGEVRRRDGADRRQARRRAHPPGPAGPPLLIKIKIVAVARSRGYGPSLPRRSVAGAPCCVRKWLTLVTLRGHPLAPLPATCVPPRSWSCGGLHRPDTARRPPQLQDRGGWPRGGCGCGGDGGLAGRRLRTPAKESAKRPAKGTTSRPVRRDVASEMTPTIGGDARKPSRISQDTTVRPVPGRKPGSSSAACIAAGTSVATPKPAAANPAIVPGTVGKASARPMPPAAIRPPVRATARWPNRSTSRSPISRPTNCAPTRAM